MAIVSGHHGCYGKAGSPRGRVAGMKLVELFCGCGGFSRGAHAAGFEVAAAYDIDPILTSSYPTNYPRTVLHHRNVGELTADEIRVDVGEEPFGIFGGPPCQGFSEIGKQNVADPRRDLLGHFFRIVYDLKPAFFIMENVRGLAFKNSRPVLDAALQVVRPDYDILGPEVWEASQFGAATTRPRMFVIGIRKTRKAAITRAHILKYEAVATTVADAIGDLIGATPFDDLDDDTGFDLWKLDEACEPSAYAQRLRSDDLTFSGHRKTAHTAKVIERFAAVKPGGYEKVGRHPRLHPEGLCPTLRAGTGVEQGSFQSVRPIHPTENRVITVREAARLQGFPDNHVFHPTVWHSFRMIGNSVSPIIAKAMFLAVADALGLKLKNGKLHDPVVVPFRRLRCQRRRDDAKTTRRYSRRINRSGR